MVSALAFIHIFPRSLAQSNISKKYFGSFGLTMLALPFKTWPFDPSIVTTSPDLRTSPSEVIIEFKLLLILRFLTPTTQGLPRPRATTAA